MDGWMGASCVVLCTWTSFIFCSEFCFSSSRCSSCAWFSVSTSWSYTIYTRTTEGGRRQTGGGSSIHDRGVEVKARCCCC